MLAVIVALLIAMIPSTITAIAAALQMPSWRMRDEADIAALAVFEGQLDIATLQCLDGARAVPAKVLTGFGEHPARISLLAERAHHFAAEVAVFSGPALDKTPMK